MSDQTKQILESPLDFKRVDKSLLSQSPLHRRIRYTGKAKHMIIMIRRMRKKIDKSKLRDEEYQTIRRNLDMFYHDYPLDSDAKTHLLGFFTRSGKYTMKEKRQMIWFRRMTKFYRRIGKDLPNRTMKKIMSAARRRFSPLKTWDEITQHDRDLMEFMYYGTGVRGWARIAKVVECEPSCVYRVIANRLNEQGEPLNRGKWTRSESKLLLKGLKEYFKTDDLKNHIFAKRIKYRRIQLKTGINRSADDCRRQWNRRLRWRVANFDRMMDQFSKEDVAKLIYSLFRLNYSKESDIDWHFLMKKFTKITRLDNIVKNWTIIKSIVVDSESKSYEEIIEFLFDNYLPIFVRNEKDLKLLEDFYHSSE